MKELRFTNDESRMGDGKSAVSRRWAGEGSRFRVLGFEFRDRQVVACAFAAVILFHVVLLTAARAFDSSRGAAALKSRAGVAAQLDRPDACPAAGDTGAVCR